MAKRQNNRRASAQALADALKKATGAVAVTVRDERAKTPVERAIEAGATTLILADEPTTQRVNVDFPIEMLARIDAEAERLGVPRQSYIKIRIADALAALRVLDEGGK